MRPLRVIDLFAGLRGWSLPFERRGHEVWSVDFDPSFPGISLYEDILRVKPGDAPWKPDLVLASPPCHCFSVMNINKYWDELDRPRRPEAVQAVRLVRHTLKLIQAWDPAFWILENPRGKLRKLRVVAGLPRVTVTFCQYGEPRMKPTDLWGRFPPSLRFKPVCKNGDPCHVAAPRGSYTGSQGLPSAEAAKIPRALSLAVLRATEKDLRKKP